MTKSTKALVTAGLLAAYAGLPHAAVTAEEANKLGTSLTVVGAEKGGNKDGTIPEYTGGLVKPPAGFAPGSAVRPDPFADEKPLFSIDAMNMDKYADKLTEGTKALMKAYSGYRIDVYPTHRTAAFPKWVLDNTIKNAVRAKSSDDGLSVHGAHAGIPFPIPKNGNEVMHNFLASFQGTAIVMPKYSAWNVNSAGKAIMSAQGVWTQDFPYYDQKAEESSVLYRVRASYTGPARRNGEGLMMVEPLDYTANESRAWAYLPGQRRTRLAPDLAYDAPNSSTAGMSTVDDVNLFNGKQDRYDFKLVGKREIYVPYNTYRLTYTDKPEDALKAKFINPDMVRWELHRVWVVDAKLKEGQRHIYSRRTFYVDEDSWNILASDQYDGRGQFWRPGFAYQVQNYDVPAPSSMAAGHYDLIAGSYYLNTWPGTGGMKISDALLPESSWTPDNLAGKGIR